MPSTLPVPSKGALRALRTLALGTTCTVAFTVGVLTEDRRRRINTVQQACDNARKIKASRQYHSTGAADAIEAFIIKNRDENFLQPDGPLPNGAVLMDTAGGQMLGHGEEMLWQASTQPPPIASSKHSKMPVRSPMQWAPIFPPSQRHSDFYQSPRSMRNTPEPPKAASDTLPKSHRQIDSRNMSLVASHQHILAVDISKLLGNGTASDVVDEARARFFDAFQKGLQIDDSGIIEELMDAAARLSRACVAQKDFDAAEKILRIILGHGKIGLEAFLSFDSEAIMRGLSQERPNQDPHNTGFYKANLRKACSLYLTNFKTRPKAMPETMLTLGTKLCERASRYELFDLVEGLYWRVERYKNGIPLSLVQHLIIAAHKEERHARVLKYFKRFYIQTSPDQLQFYTVLGLVMKTIFDSDRHRVSEEILVSASQMAQREGISMSTTWFLKVLGHDWRSHRDIVRTRALFDRLQEHFHLTQHPEAAYRAMIQFCIEANDEPAAAAYYGRLTESHRHAANDVRIQGHFTLAKAMRSDWSGVMDGLKSMQELGPDAGEFSASFTPILNLFAQSHNVHETEEFLRSFIHQYGGVLTPYLSNLMISEYVKAGEFDSVSRWLDYMATVNCQVDSSFFNVILRDCYYKFKLSYEEVCQLYRAVTKLYSQATRFVNSDTLSTLREIAMSSSGLNVAKGVKRLQLLKLDVPIKRTNCGRNIRQGMVVALANGNPDRALKIYRQALGDQIPLSDSTVSLAIRAALKRYPENVDAATCLLQDSQQAGQSVKHALASMFVYLLSDVNSDTEITSAPIKDVAQNTICSLESRGIAVPSCVITHTMNMLIKRYQYQEAKFFWDSTSHRKGHPPIPVDLHTLTTLLRVYVGLRDPWGVEWVIETLTTDNITPDRQFQQTLVKARREAEKLVTPYFTHAVVKALNVVNELRTDVTRQKEAAKMKVLQIMESAIYAEEAGYTERSERLEAWADEPGLDLPGFEPGDSTDAWIYAAKKPVREIDDVPRASLVGVAAA